MEKNKKDENSSAAMPVMIGNPMREADVYWDVVATPPRPGSGGIADDRLENTPSWWKEMAHAADLYAEASRNDVGEHKISIYKLVQGRLWGRNSLPHQIYQLIRHPFREIPAAIRAAIDGIRFAASGTRQHINYPIQPVIDYLRADDIEAAA